MAFPYVAIGTCPIFLLTIIYVHWDALPAVGKCSFLRLRSMIADTMEHYWEGLSLDLSCPRCRPLLGVTLVRTASPPRLRRIPCTTSVSVCVRVLGTRVC